MGLLFVRGDYERKPQIYYCILLYTLHFGDKFQHFIFSISQVLNFVKCLLFLEKSCHAYSFPPFLAIQWAQLPNTNTNPLFSAFHSFKKLGRGDAVEQLNNCNRKHYCLTTGRLLRVGHWSLDNTSGDPWKVNSSDALIQKSLHCAYAQQVRRGRA